MKILRKNDIFKKVPDSSIVDAVAIKGFIEQGWKYCSRKEYKEFFGGVKDLQQKDLKSENIKPEDNIQPTKKKKHGKNK